jgi:nitrite reductase/ring-hydroxylating ferredoxin subunit
LKIERVDLSDLKQDQHKFFSDVFVDELLVYKHENEYFAISTFCPHFGGPLVLAEGKLNCYWHDWDFHLTEHHCINRRIDVKAKRYKVQLISDNTLEISE